jgi:hypothetical protein
MATTIAVSKTPPTIRAMTHGPGSKVEGADGEDMAAGLIPVAMAVSDAGGLESDQIVEAGAVYEMGRGDKGTGPGTTTVVGCNNVESVGAVENIVSL